MKSTEDILREIWPDWHLESQIGAGAYGEVYQAVREDVAGRSTAAIKIIKLHPDRLRTQYPDETVMRTEFDRLIRRFSREIQVMQSLKGQTNLVSIDDYSIQWEQDICYIFIRMELLTPLLVDLDIHGVQEERLIRMGIDLCRGLEVCENEQIVHRDIRPENIFVNRFGDYKLGDFGMARTLDISREMMTSLDFGQLQRFAAPEVKNGRLREAGFDEACRADIYSLGMVLYWIANGQRFPFLPDRQLFSAKDREEAEQRRLRGDPLPVPETVSPGLRDVILKACAFDSHQRYESARAFREALEALGRQESTKTVKTKQRGRGWLWIAAVLCLVLTAGILFAAGIFGPGPESGTAGERTPEAAAAVTAAVEDGMTPLQFTGVKYPKRYAIGKPFEFPGIIASDAGLTELTINLYTDQEVFTQKKEFPPDTKLYEMRNVGDDVFRNLDEGAYTTELILTDAAGRSIGFSNVCSASYAEEEQFLYDINRKYTSPELQGTFAYGGHTYEVYRMPGGGWHTANSFAQGKGGHLVTFANAEEFSNVGSFCQGLGVKYLNIGAEYVDRQWRWVDGTPFDFHPWNTDAKEDDQYLYTPVGGIVYTQNQHWCFGKTTEYGMGYFILEYDEYLH